MPRGNAAALNTPNPARSKATIKESVRRRKAIKAVESLGNLDLATIDEQINDLEKQIARLKNAKKVNLLQLRGETPAAIEPGKPVNGDALLHRSKTCRPWTRSMPASRAARPWVPTRSPPTRHSATHRPGHPPQQSLAIRGDKQAGRAVK